MHLKSQSRHSIPSSMQQREIDRKTNYECFLAVHYQIKEPEKRETISKRSDIDFSEIVPLTYLLKCSTVWQMAEKSEKMQKELMVMSKSFDMVKFASEKLGQSVRRLWKNAGYSLEASHLSSLSHAEIRKLSKDPGLLLRLQIFFQSAYILCNLKGMSLALWKDHCESQFMLLAMALCYGVNDSKGSMDKEYDEFYCAKASSVWILFSDFCESFYKEKRFKMSVLGIVMKKVENWLWLVKILKSPNKTHATAMYQLHLSQMGSAFE